MKIRKQYYFVVALAFTFQSYSQTKLGFIYNVDLYKPYSKETQIYMQQNDSIRSYTSELYLNRTVFSKSKHHLDVGLSYKFIYFKVFRKFEYVGTWTDSYIDTTYYPTDLITKSHSLGINFDYEYDIFFKSKRLSNIGVSSNIYFFEYSKSYYRPQNNGSIGAKPYTYHPLFQFSSINLSVYYTQFLVQKEKFTLGAKVSVGTNLYSDWNLFRKYIWLGVGLEMGFGNGNKGKKTLEK